MRQRARAKAGQYDHRLDKLTAHMGTDLRALGGSLASRFESQLEGAEQRCVQAIDECRIALNRRVDALAADMSAMATQLSTLEAQRDELEAARTQNLVASAALVWVESGPSEPLSEEARDLREKMEESSALQQELLRAKTWCKYYEGEAARSRQNELVPPLAALVSMDLRYRSCGDCDACNASAGDAQAG